MSTIEVSLDPESDALPSDYQTPRTESGLEDQLVTKS